MQTTKANRFGAFADEDQVAAEVKVAQQEQKKVAEPKKKVVVKVAKQQDVEGAEEFERVYDKNAPARGSDSRGRGRGGRGGERGGRGGRGGRPEGQDGERRGGERRGRGRGDRPRTAVPTAAVEGEEAKADRPQRAERRGGRGKQYEGKAREDAHPMDRKDGTGKAHRGEKKAGHGKGNWGKDNEESKDVAEGEERKERKPREPKEPREPREPREKKEEEPKPEPIVEEEVGFTLDDYMQVKQSKAQGLYKTNQVREHQKMDAKNIKGFEPVHEEQATTRIYMAKDTIPTSAGTNANLLGFQANNDAGEEFEARGSRGGRGGRGGDRPRQDRPQTQRGGRKNNRFVVDDNEFPAL